ncbi:MAG: hypothetical protein R3B82_17160 [Sandaracinaceae bacterium]
MQAEPEPEPEPVAEPEPEPEPEPAPEERAAGGSDDVLATVIPGAVVAGVGVIAFVASAVTFSLREDALSARDALCPDAVCPTVADREEALAQHADASTYTDATNALLVVGLVAVAGGGALVAVGFRSAAARTKTRSR